MYLPFLEGRCWGRVLVINATYKCTWPEDGYEWEYGEKVFVKLDADGAQSTINILFN